MYKTMDEIKIEFDGFWVFMANCKENERGSIVGGEVLLYGKNGDELIKDMATHREAKNTYFRYVGDIPEGMGVLL